MWWPRAELCGLRVRACVSHRRQWSSDWLEANKRALQTNRTAGAVHSKQHILPTDGIRMALLYDTRISLWPYLQHPLGRNVFKSSSKTVCSWGQTPGLWPGGKYGCLLPNLFISRRTSRSKTGWDCEWIGTFVFTFQITTFHSCWVSLCKHASFDFIPSVSGPKQTVHLQLPKPFTELPSHQMLTEITLQYTFIWCSIPTALIIIYQPYRTYGRASTPTVTLWQRIYEQMKTMLAHARSLSKYQSSTKYPNNDPHSS